MAYMHANIFLGSNLCTMTQKISMFGPLSNFAQNMARFIGRCCVRGGGAQKRPYPPVLSVWYLWLGGFEILPHHYLSFKVSCGDSFTLLRSLQVFWIFIILFSPEDLNSNLIDYMMKMTITLMRIIIFLKTALNVFLLNKILTACFT